MNPCTIPEQGCTKLGSHTSPGSVHSSLQTQGVNEAHGGREGLLMPALQGADAPVLTPASPSGPSFGHLPMEIKI